MSKISIIKCSLITILTTTLLTTVFFEELKEEKTAIKNESEIYNTAKSNYQVYLDGEKIGLISSKDNLYSLINQEQVEIKKYYNVDQVYPPKGFQIIKTNSYDNNISSVEDVYDAIKEEKEFTIKGYTVTIKSTEDGVEPLYIHVLDKELFEKTINNVVEIFIGKERYNQYLTNTQPEIVDTGYTIENMYFKDNISIRESYISVDEKIYTDEQELTKYLLFGNNNSSKEYTVVQGDTIESIAEANHLNTGELLIANDNIKSEDTLLAIGQKINVALINPVLNLTYEELVVQDVERIYNTVYEEDNTKYTDYRSTKQQGIKGIDRVTSRVQFINGEQNQGAAIDQTNIVTIRPVQNEIIIKGTKKQSIGGGITGAPVETGGAWAWPTNSPYVLTSPYGYRWGTLHDGLDISGTGRGSPIYASLGGVVVSAQYGGMVGSSAGLNVVIEHSNGYYTVYAHCSAINVKVGQTVSRRQRIASMGDTGTATGVHLHFGVFYGKPYNGGRSINPLRLWN